MKYINALKYMFSRGRAIPIPITTIGMRLPHNRIDIKRVTASKPQALGMIANNRLPAKHIQKSYIRVARATLNIAPVGFALMISTKPLCASANFFTRASPKPVPVVSRVDSAAER
jgi:hypothetical protein